MKIQAAFRLALSQIARNKVMAAASLFAITAILLVLGLFFVIVVNINNWASEVKRDFDKVQVYLLDTVDLDHTQLMMTEINGMDGVIGTSYLTREQAMEEWKTKWGDNADLLDRLKTNALPNSIIVEVTSLEQATAVVYRIETMEGVENVNYSQDLVDKLLKITRIVQIVSLVIILFLVIVSVMVVSNTIKLTVIAREREITIMRYVGATNWYIRGPFLMEGVIIGAIGAGIAGGLMAVIYHALSTRLGLDITLLLSVGLVPEWFLIRNLLAIFLALGVSIGACGSIISMRRFLDR